MPFYRSCRARPLRSGAFRHTATVFRRTPRRPSRRCVHSGCRQVPTMPAARHVTVRLTTRRPGSRLSRCRSGRNGRPSTYGAAVGPRPPLVLPLGPCADGSSTRDASSSSRPQEITLSVAIRISPRASSTRARPRTMKAQGLNPGPGTSPSTTTAAAPVTRTWRALAVAVTSRPPSTISDDAGSNDQPPGTTCASPYLSTVAILAKERGGCSSHRRSGSVRVERAMSDTPESGCGPANDHEPGDTRDDVHRDQSEMGAR
jgi:hypothetical protein